MSYMSTPQYPVITWPVYYTALGNDLELECDGNSLSIDPSNGDFDGKYGFSSDSSNIADSDSVHGLLASKIQDFLVNDCGFATATCVATYVWDIPGWPRVRLDITNTGGNDLTLLAYSKDIGDFFGIDYGAGGLVTISASTGGPLDWNSVGYWAPRNLTVYDDRVSISPSTYSSESLDGTTHRTVSWSANKITRQLTFPFVRPPYLWTYRREDSCFSDVTETNVADPNNLFENFLAAARRSNTSLASTNFRIYTGAGDYRNGVIMDPQLLKDPGNMVTETSAGSATYFNVKVMFRDLGGDGI